MGIVQDFKTFAVKGNVIDLAVGVIIGTAFAKIVDSLVSDLIMPVIGALLGKLDFSSLFIVLGITQAAVDLHLTQSSISRQIASLEFELGVPLFKRKTRALELTLAGQTLAKLVGSN